MSEWRYLAYRLDGAGGQALLMPDLLLADVELGPTLSGAPTFKATVPVEVPLYLDGGEPVFVPWSTMVAVDYGGDLRGCFIVTDVSEQGPKLDLTGVGYTGYPKGLPAEGERSFTDTDATDVLRAIWANVQGQPGANLGVVVDDVKGGARLGRLSATAWPKVVEGAKAPLPPVGSAFQYEWTKTPAAKAVTKKTTKVVNGKKTVTTTTTPAKAAVLGHLYGEATRAYPKPIPEGSTVILRDVKTGALSRDLDAKGLPAGKAVYGVATAKEPKKDDEGTELKALSLSWWEDADLGAKIDAVTEQGGFDWWEEHRWAGEGIEHRLRIAAPLAGRVRHDLRFVVGENVVDTPQLDRKGDDFASEVVVLGAGEGRSMIRGTWKLTSNPRTRRVKTVTDKAIQTVTEANRRAEREGLIANGAINVGSLTIMDHPNARLGSIELGDTITVQGDGQGWTREWSMQVRVLAMTIDPDKDTATLTVAQGERGSA